MKEGVVNKGILTQVYLASHEELVEIYQCYLQTQIRVLKRKEDGSIFFDHVVDIADSGIECYMGKYVILNTDARVWEEINEYTEWRSQELYSPLNINKLYPNGIFETKIR